ncbi:MAG: hypothetical protein IPK12_21850 [Gemmatimonadetes bacterium]|nr:hypothetical protein [Gemmatimonadota bacterium]
MAQDERGTLEILKHSPPGERFRAYHRAASRGKKGRATDHLLMVLGVVIVVLGLVALPAPGPGFLIIAVGGGLIARQSERVATLLDRGEVGLRAFLAHGRRAWEAASWLERGLFVLVMAAAALVAGYWTLFWLLRG